VAHKIIKKRQEEATAKSPNQTVYCLRNTKRSHLRLAGPTRGRALITTVLLATSMLISTRTAAQADELSGVTVWVNTRSHTYHCPGTRSYGKTKFGRFMSQAQAQRDGYHPAHGRMCGELSRKAATGTQCGFERWPVKVLVDRDRNRVDFKPIPSSVTELAALQNTAGHYPYDRRINDNELHVYSVRARLVARRYEVDSDIHVVIAEPDSSAETMITEIPAPFCALGSGHEADYQKAREDAIRIPLGSVVEVEGVGFFDIKHAQKGVAKNGFELHPVLRISRVQ
jgi:hypothetical protein